MTESVRILRIAAGGDGVGRLADGRTLFVPRTAPGDLIETADLRLHARFARARIGRIIEAGPERIEPRCAHYRDDACGGCQLQHMDSASQHAARRAIAGDALRRIARLDVPDPDLSDPRVRIAGGPLVLVEFPSMQLPPNCEWALHTLRQQGWRPIIAHPERYRNHDPRQRFVLRRRGQRA